MLYIQYFPNQSTVQPAEDKIQRNFAFHPNKNWLLLFTPFGDLAPSARDILWNIPNGLGCDTVFMNLGWNEKKYRFWNVLCQLNQWKSYFLSYPLWSVILFHEPSVVSELGWQDGIWSRVFRKIFISIIIIIMFAVRLYQIIRIYPKNSKMNWKERYATLTIFQIRCLQTRRK